MNYDFNSAALFAESLRLTLRQTDGVVPSLALRRASTLRARDVQWRSHSASPFKSRDPLAQRRLLVAS